ncbi:MAG: hypothetical protein B7X71_17615, partial [Polynucleobacter sp. 39-46-10]
KPRNESWAGIHLCLSGGDTGRHIDLLYKTDSQYGYSTQEIWCNARILTKINFLMFFSNINPKTKL